MNPDRLDIENRWMVCFFKLHICMLVGTLAAMEASLAFILSSQPQQRILSV